MIKLHVYQGCTPQKMLKTVIADDIERISKYEDYAGKTIAYEESEITDRDTIHKVTYSIT